MEAELVRGGHWVISSSKAYTRTARIIRGGVYAEIIPGYSCRDEDYYNNNNIDIKFDIDLPSDTRPRYGVLSVYTRQDGNVFDVIKFNNKTWKNSEGNLTIPPLSSIWPETNTVYLKSRVMTTLVKLAWEAVAGLIWVT